MSTRVPERWSRLSISIIKGGEGAAAIEPAEVIRVSGLEPGGPFDATGVVEARDRIVTHYY